MKEKIRVAFIYKKSNVLMTGKHYDNTYYHFFTTALKRNHKIDVTYFPTGETFNASILKDKFDVILLFHNHTLSMPNEIIGIRDLDMPVIARVTDPRVAKESIALHEKWKIDYYFMFWPESFFYKLWPRRFKYKTIVFGLEPSLYHNVTPFDQRIKDRILNSGSVGNTKFFSRIINDIRNPKWNALRCYYLRTICNNLPYVDYTSTLQHEFVNDKYPLLLQKYAAAIAASSYTSVIKMWEIPAAGCLSFIEVSKKNDGDYLGYIDGETAIFINEENYKERFEEYITDVKNPKWEKIANAGRKYTLEEFNNDKAVESLVELMEKLLSK